MRSDQEMLELIVSTAKGDDRIRAAVMNGSRVNSNSRKDAFQDFDVVFFVTDVDSFKNDDDWINRFGEIMILQTPETMEDPPGLNDGRFTYLMQFTDGNRIDLTIFPIESEHIFQRDSLDLLLIDKDGVVEPYPGPSDRDYLPIPPTSKAFSDCCNEFWWVSAYVAKGLWREEIIYAKYMLDQVLRVELMKMLIWYMGLKTNFLRSPGKHGKDLKHYLTEVEWAMLEKTYSDSSYENTWDALHMMCDLFRHSANQVAAHFGFDYPRGEDEKVSAHLRHVRSLPRDAKEMY